MNFYINQTICINYLRVEAVTNSSVLQIGSAGIIKPLSNLYNTGGFTEPAPPLTPETVGPIVPLTSPTAR